MKSFLLFLGGICPLCIYKFCFVRIENIKQADKTTMICPNCKSRLVNVDRETISGQDYRGIDTLKEVEVC